MGSESRGSRGSSGGQDLRSTSPGDGDGASAAAGGLPELDLASLRDRARRAIRGSIVTGQIGAGELHPVSYFAAQLGVSATPIREALFDLAGEGLIEVVRNRGFRVPLLSEHDLDELYELRLLLELPAVVRVARERAPLDILRLRRLASELVSQARHQQVIEFLWSDRTFHLEVLAGLGNRRLVDAVARLRDEARLHGITSLSAAGQLVPTAAEHGDLLDALESGDQELVEARMRLHLGHTRGLWAGREGTGRGGAGGLAGGA
ncbi:MAG: GntR family transcriptional regulator [Candidatus Dormibacteria bacterium]